jgi:hypothetical protein
MTGASYSTPHEYGRTHPNPDEALDTAATLARTLGHDGWVRILHGLAARNDLTEAQTDRVIDLAPDTAWSLHETLLANPHVSHLPAVTDLFTADMIVVFLGRDDVLDFADHILRTCDHHRKWDTPNQADLLGMIRKALGPTVIEDYFARTCTPADLAQATENVRHPLLTGNGFNALLSVVETLDADGQPENAQLLFSGLCRRPDITDTQGLALVSMGERLSKRERGSARWRFISLTDNPDAPVAAMTKLLTHRTRGVRDMVLTSRNLSQSTVHAALRAHIPYAIMKADRPIPADAADVLLSDLEAGTARRQVLSPEEIVRFVTALLHRASGAEIWDRALTILHTHSPSPVEAFFDIVWSRPAHWSENTITVSSQDTFLDWARIHALETLRAEAAGRIFLPHHLAEAAHDPSVRVRLAVVGNPQADADVLHALVEDEDDAVRAAVTERFLSSFDTV